MSRAEKKLAEYKAKEELARLKAEKRTKQQQEWEETKKKWAAMPPGVKRTIKVVGILIVAIVIISAISSPDAPSSNGSQPTETETETKNSETIKERTPKEKLTDDIVKLITSKEAFDTGSYIKGDIPQGEYIFMPVSNDGKYYSEEDAAGNIIDNENFDSFGYVFVHGAGNLTTQGVLISVSSLKNLSATGAKDIYEKLNETSKYRASALYKVGTDIKAGQYTIQSQGSAYVAILTGPVGNNDIVDNENFNGKHSVDVKNGQYLSISRGEMTRQ